MHMGLTTNFLVVTTFKSVAQERLSILSSNHTSSVAYICIHICTTQREGREEKGKWGIERETKLEMKTRDRQKSIGFNLFETGSFAVCIMLVSFSQVRVTWEERTLTEELHLPDWPVGISAGHFLA